MNTTLIILASTHNPPAFHSDAVGHGQGQLHQRAADGRHRRLDQLDVLRFRHHQSAVPAHVALQADAAARRRAGVAGRRLGVVGVVVLPQRVRAAQHLHAGAGRE